MRRRVVVTGVGLVCALGIGTEEVWGKLMAGASGVGPITQFDASGFDCRRDRHYHQSCTLPSARREEHLRAHHLADRHDAVAAVDIDPGFAPTTVV